MADTSLPLSGLSAAGAGSRRSLGRKVSHGCGLLLLVFLATCGSFTWIARRQAESAADRGWAQLRAPFERLRDDRGTVALFRESPGLRVKFGSEEGFLTAAKAWRPKVAALPARRPPLGELLGRDGTRFRIRPDAVKGQPRTWIRYAQPGGATFTVEFERGQVVDLDVQ